MLQKALDAKQYALTYVKPIVSSKFKISVVNNGDQKVYLEFLM